ncbi:MAG: helix-turn-helix transcriptional regulator [Pseudomonadota bacterium]
MIGIDNEEIHHLWDSLSDFDISQPEAAVAWLMESLVEMEGVCNATWAGAIRMDGHDASDPLRGWRVAASGALRPLELRSEDGHLAGVMDVWDRREIDPSFLLPMKQVGHFRTYSLRRGLPPEWFTTPFYRKHYGAFGIHDLVLIGFPLNEDCESHFGFYSFDPISDETIARFTYAMRGIKWFHRHLMLAHGLLVASSPITPTEQRVLHFLLTELPEKQIAQQLELGVAATHRHVTTLFRKFGVRSRAGLISLWLNRPGGS